MALKQYVKDARDIATAMGVYMNKLNMTGFSGAFPYLEDVINENIKYVSSATKIGKLVNLFTDPIDTKNVLENAFAFVNEIMKIRTMLHEVLDIFIKHQINPSQEGSQTTTGSTITQSHINDLYEMLSDLREIMDSYLPRSQIDELRETFADITLTHVQDSKDEYYTKETARRITDEYEKYSSKGQGNNVVLFYQTLMEHIIERNTGHPDGAKVVRMVMKLIEGLKTVAVASPRLQLIGNGNKKNNTVQRLIQMNNIKPSETMKPLPDALFDLIGVKVKSTDIAKACKVASTNEKKVGLIIMRKVSKNPMVHYIMPLIDKKTVTERKLFQSSDAGVNRMLYERTLTIAPLPTNAKASDSIDVYDGEHSGSDLDVFYILETIDGVNYRPLSPYDIDSENYAIPAAWVRNIPVFDKTPSRRMCGYNETLNDVILSHLKKPLVDMDFMSRDEIRKAEIKWKNIRENIRSGIKEKFRDKLKTKASLTNLLASAQLQSHMLLAITQELDDVDRVRNDVYYEEMSLSYLKDLQDIQRRMGRDLVNIYQKDFATKSGNLVKVFDDVLEAVLNKYINNKSNIFLTIRFKSELLEKTLLHA
jgi:hypothetical protein